MPLYRVDKRQFNEGEIIIANPASYYDSNNFGDNKKRIEDLLNSNRPNQNRIPERNKCLFIFSELYDAVKFWVLQKDSIIYEVARCKDTTLFFRGDMNITDFMLHIDNENLLKILSEQYWRPIHTYKACIEILVDKVSVVKKITIDETQRNRAYQEYYDSSKKIESISFYKSTLPTT